MCGTMRLFGRMQLQVKHSQSHIACPSVCIANAVPDVV